MMVYLFAQKCCRQIKLLLDKVSNWGPYGTFYSEKIGRNLWCFMGFFIQKEVWKANFKCKLSKLQVSDEGNWQWAIDIWEDFVKLIKLFVVTVRSKQLKQYIMQQLKRVSYQSFDLHLLRNVAARLNCFLTKFQIWWSYGSFSQWRNEWDFVVAYGFLYSKRDIKNLLHMQTFQTSSVWWK